MQNKFLECHDLLEHLKNVNIAHVSQMRGVSGTIASSIWAWGTTERCWVGKEMWKRKVGEYDLPGYSDLITKHG